ncbi:YdcF family protein [Metallumcola ferriviriculae]|uniref:YdcF family protein n=1 Tax=Metallumcola ferriviriculae TaxID=3039180 RepID=A0AAU0UPF9_9FIRM|nr:YdcF family protein [Desulfitibacteraceae bacterium MK1]
MLQKGLMKKIKVLALLAVLGVVGVLSINFMIKFGGEKHIFPAQRIEPVQAAIVLGARVYSDGRVSPMLADRLNKAIDLYQSGKAEKLLLSGDHGQKSYDEVNTMRQFVLEKGVPSEDIFMDHAGFSTYDSMYRARDIFNIDRAAVITQEFHLPRAVFTARSLGIDAVGLKADQHTYYAENYYEFREILARNKAFLQLFILHSTPKYLGDAIPITGDGRVTWDKL